MENVRDRTNYEFIPLSEFDRMIDLIDQKLIDPFFTRRRQNDLHVHYFITVML